MFSKNVALLHAKHSPGHPGQKANIAIVFSDLARLHRFRESESVLGSPAGAEFRKSGNCIPRLIGLPRNSKTDAMTLFVDFIQDRWMVEFETCPDCSTKFNDTVHMIPLFLVLFIAWCYPQRGWHNAGIAISDIAKLYQRRLPSHDLVLLRVVKTVSNCRSVCIVDFCLKKSTLAASLSNSTSPSVD